MVPQPRLNEESLELLVSHSIGTEETVSEAIVEAFLEANVNVFARETVLKEWIDTDALEALDRRSHHPFYVSSPVWDHQVVITSDEVRVYTDLPVETGDRPPFLTR
jgi:hypothetical protein